MTKTNFHVLGVPGALLGAWITAYSTLVVPDRYKRMRVVGALCRV